MDARRWRNVIIGLVTTLVIGGWPLSGSVPGSGQSATAQTRRRTTKRVTITDTSVVAIGATLKVKLENSLSSKESRAGDRFTATVVDPEQYEGATVRGHVSSIKKSGKVKGRTSMVLAFDSIELRNGRSGPMRGEIVRIYGEDSARADEEGAVESGSRGKQTVKRGAIGGAAGAVVGGLIGGAKGAVIGLIVGGAGGAGSVAVKGSKELKLESGTRMLIRVTRR
jgi:hypothetical protein